MKKIRTHYDTLKVARDAPASVIKAAYRILSQEYHPDRSSHPDAVRIMSEINVSYDILSDITERRLHDNWIAEQEKVAPTQPEHEDERTSRPRPGPGPKPAPQPPKTPPHPQQEVPPEAPGQKLQRGIRAVPARLWILGAIVLAYSAWLVQSRFVDVNGERPGTTAAVSNALDQPSSTGRDPILSLPSPTESTPVRGKRPSSVARPAGDRERERPKQKRKYVLENKTGTAAAESAPDAAAVRLPERQPWSPGEASDRVRQEDQTGYHSNAGESEPLASVNAQEAPAADARLPQTSQRFVLQVAALASLEKAANVQAKLRAEGISSHMLRKGELIVVRVGPLVKEEAEKVRAKLGRIGMSAFMVPL